jgi:energy-coupling factor transporter ATP-binding protein EcfA2
MHPLPLDPKLIGDVLAVVRGLAEAGATMLGVMRVLAQVADRVVFMEEGRIVEQAASPFKPVGNYSTDTSPALPGNKIVLRAFMDFTAMDVTAMDVTAIDVIAVASSCPRHQIPLNDLRPQALRRVVCHA